MTGAFSRFLRDIGRRPARSRAPRPATLRLERLDELIMPALSGVSGQSNIYAAGQPAAFLPPSPGGGGGGVRPKEVALWTLGSPASLAFPAVTGIVSGWAAAGNYNGPDGGPNWGGKTLVPAWKGISGIRHDDVTMPLVGVFLGPNGQPATPPPALDVTGANDASSSRPLLGQQFFIGDGRTSSRALQTVTVPAGATTLALGFAEGFGFGHNNLPGFYGDNGGSLSVTVEPAPAGVALDSASVSYSANALTPSVAYRFHTAGNPGGFTAALYQSADPRFDPSDTLIASRAVAAPPNSSGAGSFTLNFTPLPGKPYLLVVVDPQTFVAQSNGYPHELPAYLLSAARLRAVVPTLSAPEVSRYLGPLNEAMQEFRITTPKRVAAFLAQVAVESAGLSRWEENLTYTSVARLREVYPSSFPTTMSDAEVAAFIRQPVKLANRVYANKNGNGDAASGDGWRYRGRGPIQLTGRANYAAAGAALGFAAADAGNPVNDPGVLADPSVGLRSAAWFFATHHPTDTAGGRSLKGKTSLTDQQLGLTLPGVADLADLRSPRSLRDVNKAVTAGVNSGLKSEPERLGAFRRGLVAFYGEANVAQV